jgi:tetratricopeptide (TPR) repeat protein
MWGLAVGARPSLLFGAAVLLVPVVQAFRDQRKVWGPLLAALGPITLIGIGLMFYNSLRFDNPFEFGFRYQLAGDRQLTQQSFSLRYLWFNFRAYFLELARWSARFPFVHSGAATQAPTGHGPVEQTFGILVNIPLVWLSLALPLAWRNRSEESRYSLDWFLASVGLLFGIAAVTLGLYYYTAGRYEVEFLPALVLLAVSGIWGVERALARQPVQRRAVRWAWSVLLVFSVAFNLLACAERWAESHDNQGMALQLAGRTQEAIPQYEAALRLNPELAQAHYNLGFALEGVSRMQEAIPQYEEAVRLKPDYADAHNNLAGILRAQGKLQEAIDHYEQAIREKPVSASYKVERVAVQHCDTQCVFDTAII